MIKALMVSEMVLDEELKGGVQQEIVATDNKGNAIFGSVLSKFLPDKGKSVTLTIDATIQFIAERALDKAMADRGLNMLALLLWILRLVKFSRWQIVQAMILTIITKVGKRLSKILRLPIYMNQALHSNLSLHLQLLQQAKWKLDTVYNDKGLSPMDISLETGMVEGYGPVRLLDILEVLY